MADRIFAALSKYLASGRCTGEILLLLQTLPWQTVAEDENQENSQALKQIYDTVFSRFEESFEVPQQVFVPRMCYIEFLACLAPRLREEAQLYQVFLDHFSDLALNSDMTALVNFERCPELRIKFMEKIFELLEIEQYEQSDAFCTDASEIIFEFVKNATEQEIFPYLFGIGHILEICSQINIPLGREYLAYVADDS